MIDSLSAKCNLAASGLFIAMVVASGLALQPCSPERQTDVSLLVGYSKQDSADLGPDMLIGSGSLAEVCPWGGQM